MKDEMKVVITTADTPELVQKLCAILLEKKLAACIQEFPIKSHYRWDGALQCDNEILLLVKTSQVMEEKVIETIKQNHSYDLPEVISLPVTNGLPGYIQWVKEETSEV